MVERIPTYEHVAHMIETGEWIYHESYFSSGHYHIVSLSDSDAELIDPATEKAFYLGSEYFTIQITMRWIFPNSVSVSRAFVDLPLKRAEKRRVIEAFKVRRAAEKIKEAEQEVLYRERQQALSWYP